MKRGQDTNVRAIIERLSDQADEKQREANSAKLAVNMLCREVGLHPRYINENLLEIPPSRLNGGGVDAAAS